jgi:hypothetical protein
VGEGLPRAARCTLAAAFTACVGDIVEVDEVFGRVPAEIASISADGRLNFKGGAGFGRRPHETFLRVRASTPGAAYATARYQAAQAAALRREPGGRISAADLRELLRWYVHGGPSVTDVAAFSEALQGARDEKPLQAVLQQHPQLLTHLVTSHHGGYVRPEAWLSSQYRADFLVAGHTSLGLRWTLIELESPHGAVDDRRRAGIGSATQSGQTDRGLA